MKILILLIVIVLSFALLGDNRLDKILKNNQVHKSKLRTRIPTSSNLFSNYEEEKVSSPEQKLAKKFIEVALGQGSISAMGELLLNSTTTRYVNFHLPRDSNGNRILTSDGKELFTGDDVTGYDNIMKVVNQRFPYYDTICTLSKMHYKQYDQLDYTSNGNPYVTSELANKRVCVIGALAATINPLAIRLAEMETHYYCFEFAKDVNNELKMSQVRSIDVEVDITSGPLLDSLYNATNANELCKIWQDSYNINKSRWFYDSQFWSKVDPRDNYKWITAEEQS